MNLRWLLCTRCQARLSEELFNRGELAACPACSVPLQIAVFPAFYRSAEQGQAGEYLTAEGESSCFYHPQKKAVVPCDACGRFLCALCDCNLHGQHFCPSCLEAGRKKKKIKTLENERTLYDSIAIALAALPIVIPFIFYASIATAPAALYFAIRYWNAPRSIIHRTKIRLILAIVLASAQIIGWCVLVGFLIFSRR